MEVVAQLVRAMVCGAMGCGFKSRRPPQKHMTNKQSKKSAKRQETTKGGVAVDQIEKAVDLLRGCDWMLGNPDYNLLREEVSRQVWAAGELQLSVFVCPKFDTSALFSEQPENYMPSGVSSGDLFESRVPVIRRLREDLTKVGIRTTLNLLLGDNDAEVYIFPFFGIQVNAQLYLGRQTQYALSFKRRVEGVFGSSCVVWSLADLGITPEEGVAPSITPSQFEKEFKFFDWLFSETGPYKGKLKFTPEQLREMTQLKYALYGAQGKFLSELGGVLLQTEGPGVWLERTQMLRCTGAAPIPAIYPWIRQEELNLGG